MSPVKLKLKHKHAKRINIKQINSSLIYTPFYFLLKKTFLISQVFFLFFIVAGPLWHLNRVHNIQMQAFTHTSSCMNALFNSQFINQTNDPLLREKIAQFNCNGFAAHASSSVYQTLTQSIHQLKQSTSSETYPILIEFNKPVEHFFINIYSTFLSTRSLQNSFVTLPVIVNIENGKTQKNMQLAIDIDFTLSTNNYFIKRIEFL